jgi:hypothetical protein
MPWTPPQIRPVGYIIKKADDWDVIVTDLQYLKNILDGTEGQDVTLAQKLVVTQGLTTRPYVVETGWPGTGALTLRASSGSCFVISPGTGTVYLLGNAYFSGTDWLRLQNANRAAMVSVFDGFVQFRQAPSGTGPITWATVLTTYPSGGVAIGNAPTDPGQNNVMVQGGLTVGTNATSNVPVKLFETVLASAQSPVSFTSIPQTYRHLQLVVSARLNASVTDAPVSIQLNGDTGANYAFQSLTVAGSSVAGATYGTATRIGIGRAAGASAPANYRGAMTATLFHYTQAAHKLVESTNTLATSTTAMTSGQYYGLWANTSAITSITIFPDSNQFVADSVFTLYGLP